MKLPRFLPHRIVGEKARQFQNCFFLDWMESFLYFLSSYKSFKVYCQIWKIIRVLKQAFSIVSNVLEMCAKYTLSFLILNKIEEIRNCLAIGNFRICGSKTWMIFFSHTIQKRRNLILKICKFCFCYPKL